jgi:hypothetical protein
LRLPATCDLKPTRTTHGHAGHRNLVPVEIGGRLAARAAASRKRDQVALADFMVV